MAIIVRAWLLMGLSIVCAVMNPWESVDARPDKATREKFYGALVMGSAPQNAGDGTIADMFDKVLEKEFSENEAPEGPDTSSFNNSVADHQVGCFGDCGYNFS